MKKTLLFLTFVALMTSGCSKTWSGIKQDTHELFIDTKEVIHEATAPTVEVPASTVHNNVSSWDESAPASASGRIASAPSNVTTVTPVVQTYTVQVFEDKPTVTAPLK